MPADSDEGTARPRPMRADARRNRAQILRAARELFADKGPDVPLDDIARKAGVGVATPTGVSRSGTTWSGAWRSMSSPV